MVSCSAVHCNSCSKNRTKDLSFHQFPLGNKSLLRKWILAVNRKSWTPSKHSTLCSKHFESDQYQRNPNILRQLNNTRNILKEDAVPSIFPHRPKKKSPKIKKSILKRNVRRQVAHVQAQSNQLEEADNLPFLEEDTELDQNLHTETVTETKNLVTVTTQTYWNGESRGTQVNFRNLFHTRSVGTQTEDATTLTTSFPDNSLESSNDSDLEEKAPENNDSDWESDDPSDDEEDLTDEWDGSDTYETLSESECLSQESIECGDRIVLVSEPMLKLLLSVCLKCHSPCEAHIKNNHGTYVSYQQQCINGHSCDWSNQSLHGTLPTITLKLAAAVFATGTSVIKFINIMKYTGVEMCTVKTINTLHKLYVIPAINQIWKKMEDSILQSYVGDQNLCVTGDGRCCSPGHTAKYGSYTLMDTATNKVICMKLIQSNEVTSSNAMELKGLQECFKLLNDKGIQVAEITTDRHPSIRKHLREEFPLCKHWFDVWHIAKGVFKKLMGKGNTKDLKIIHDWAHAISNHMYYCAHEGEGIPEKVTAMWMSIGNHIVNKHTHDNPHFPKCLHSRLPRRKWIQKGSKVHKEIRLIIENKVLLKDIKQLSPSSQTSLLESYHKVVLLYAPKLVHYFYPSMDARLKLAAIHWNSNLNRDTQGHRVSYPKYKKGTPVVKAIHEVNYDFISDIIDHTESLREEYKTFDEAKVLIVDTRAPIAASYNHHPKEEVLREQKTRYKKD